LEWAENYARPMQEPELCDGCGKVTITVHGQCTNCWRVKHPELALRPPVQRRSLLRQFMDEIVALAWFFPGAALTVLALLIGGEDVLLVIGLVLLLSGGALKFGDFFPW
jgi:hypothetical protein